MVKGGPQEARLRLGLRRAPYRLLTLLAGAIWRRERDSLPVGREGFALFFGRRFGGSRVRIPLRGTFRQLIRVALFE